MSANKFLEQLDPLSFVTARLQTFYDGIQLSSATGFFYYGLFNNTPNFWLVTNWHVLSGRNADDPCKVLHSKGSLPNRLSLRLILAPDQPEYLSAADGQVLMQEMFVEIYDQSGQALWYQHAQKNLFDVAVLNANPFVGRFQISGINQVATENDMKVEIGNEVFILGYPLGFTHFMDTPIWKRGSIASEPNFETLESKNRVVIDATTRQGMSGAPVIMREKTHYITESGEIRSHINATRFVGIYASRPNIAISPSLGDEDRRAEIGYFYKSGCVSDAIEKGIRGPNFGELP